MTLIDLRNAANRAEGLTDPSLAIGLAGVTDWSTEMAFIDIAKSMRAWSGKLLDWTTVKSEQLAGGGYLDANGWPTKMPPGFAQFETIWAWNDAAAAESRKGVYVLTYEGEGTLKLGLGARVISSEPGKIVFENPTGGQMGLYMSATDPNGTGNYIHDVSIVKQEHVELHEAGALFNPDWLELVQDMRQFRFMDWMEINNSKDSAWSDRPTLDSATWSGQGVPVEVMVRLANEAGVDPWFNMPLHASDEYIRNFATYVRDHLDPKLKATIELSNETWNPLFQQARDASTEGQEEFGVTNQGERWSYLGMRASEMSQIWTDVFGAEAETRLVRVLATQTTNPWVVQQMLEAAVWRAQEPDAPKPEDVFDAVAVTTYFGGFDAKDPTARAELTAAINDPTVDEFKYFYDRLLDPANRGAIPGIVQHWLANKAIADKYGLDLVAYEGGQHVHHLAGVANQSEVEKLGSFYAAFVRSSYMADLYQALWDEWKAVSDGPFMHFVDVAAPSKYGSWGLYSHLDDTNPRAELLEELNETQAAWWESRGGSHFQQGVTTLGTSASETLTGTSQEDYLVGGAGDDTLVGGAGADALHGGAGTDTVLLDGVWSDYSVVAEGEGYRLSGPDGSDFVIAAEYLLFTDGIRVAVEDLVGDQNITLIATGGNDDLSVGTRNTIVNGAEGIDTVTLVAADARGVVVRAVDPGSVLGTELGLAAPGAQTAYTAIAGGGFETADLATVLTAGSVLVNVEKIVGTGWGDSFHGGAGDDSFAGLAGNDTLYGGAGNDSLSGGTDQDMLYGGAGDDTMRGGALADSFYGGAGTDTVYYAGLASDYVVTGGGTSWQVRGSGPTDVLVDVEFAAFSDGTRLDMAAFKALSDAVNEPKGPTQGNDVLTVATRGALIDAKGGLDAVTVETTGGRGVMVCTINGGTLLDRELTALIPGSPDGYLVYVKGTTAQFGTQTVATSYWSLNENVAAQNGARLSASAVETAKQLASIVVNAEKFVGTDFADTFFGRGGNDRFAGGAGNDYFASGAGNDILEGGAGRDVFAFGRASGTDTVLDFAVAEDTLDLRGNGIASRAALGGMASINADGDLRLDIGGGTVLVLDHLVPADLARMTILI